MAERFRLWEVPTSVWAYGLLRAAAFGAPAMTGSGAYGVGAVVTLILYVALVRRSSAAYLALLVLDTLSMVLLVLFSREAPLLVPILAGAALLALLMPSVRRYVSGRPSSSAST